MFSWFGPYAAPECRRATSGVSSVRVQSVTGQPGRRVDGATSAPEQEFDGTDPWRRPFPRLPRFLVAAAAVLTALSIGLPNIAPGVDFLAAPGSPVRQFFGVAEEANLPTFFSVGVALAAAACQALAGRLAGGRIGRALYVTAAVLLLMAFDDFAALHEHLKALGELMPGAGVLGYVWVIPGLFLGLGVLLAFRLLVTSLRGPARRDLWLGVTVVLFAALGLETVNGFLDRPGTNGAPLQVGTHLEEFTENVGLILLLRGSLALLEVSRQGSGICSRVAEQALTAPASRGRRRARGGRTAPFRGTAVRGADGGGRVTDADQRSE